MNHTKTKQETQDLFELYRQMLLIRRFEEGAAKSYSTGKIGGFCHLYIGQEAVGVGSIATLKEQDYIVSTYRDHGHALARGLDPKALMAELFGKRPESLKVTEVQCTSLIRTNDLWEDTEL